MFIRFFLIVTGLFLAGCSSMVGTYLSGQESFDPALVTSQQELHNQGFSQQQFCSLQSGTCISYLSAKALPEAKKLKYALGVDEDAEQSEVNLHLKRQDIPAFHQGTVVLIHGFRISKEFMAATALYFRFLGFDVLIPDLLGHGDSDGPLGFGVKDTEILDEWLTRVRPLSKPLFLLGNSMGSLPATRLSNMRKDIQGLILLAPMPVFDQAVVNYASQSSLSYLLPEHSLRQGAISALDNRGVTLEQTDIKPELQAMDKPVLLVLSQQDRVSPASYFAELKGENIRQLVVEKRGHRGMLLFDNEQHHKLLDWLQQQMPNQ